MSQDIDYVESVKAALRATVGEENEVDWDLFVNAEKETIIGSYCGTNLNTFKGTWKRRFKEAASQLNFRIKDSSGDTNNWKTLIFDRLKEKRKTPLKSTCSTSSNSTSTTSLNNNFISDDEKESARTYLRNLRAEEKWRLKSGRYVEDVVLKAVNDCSFEHPCLSYIIDLADPVWKNYFTSEEFEEVKNHNPVELPVIHDEVQTFIDSYDNSTLKTAGDYYTFASNQNLKFSDLFEKRWIKESIVNAAGMFEKSETLDMTDFSKNDLLHNLWSFVYRAFKNSEVKARLGERTSASSAFGSKEGRFMELTEEGDRKLVETKVDILFKRFTYELGCAKVGDHDVLVIDDQYLNDGMLNLPKTLRNMLCSLVEVNPCKINELYTIGFLMMGLDLELLIMNVPAGKTITRVNRTKRLSFPTTAKSIRLDLLPLLELTLVAKALMENLMRIIDERKRKAVVLDTNEIFASPLLPFSFVGKTSL